MKIEVCRGYPLPFDPDDPNNEVITTVAVTAPAGLTPTNNVPPLSVGWKSPASKLMPVGHGVQTGTDESTNSDTSSAVFQPSQHSPSLLSVDIVRGPMGFGFTIADSVHGQRVKQLLDRPRCRGLMEGDLLVEINNIIVRDMKHTSVVEVLQKCPVGSTASFLVQRGGQMCFYCELLFCCCCFCLLLDVSLQSGHCRFTMLNSLLKIVSHCQRILEGEGHSVAGWDIGGSVELLLQVQGLSVRSGNGQPLIAQHHLLLVPVSTSVNL